MRKRLAWGWMALGAAALAVVEAALLVTVRWTVEIPAAAIDPVLLTTARVVAAQPLSAYEQETLTGMRPEVTRAIFAILQTAQMQIDGVSIHWPAASRTQLALRMEHQMDDRIQQYLDRTAPVDQLVTPALIRAMVEGMNGEVISVRVSGISIPIRVEIVPSRGRAFG